MTNKKLEALLWSIALPGFSQLLNGKYLKGILFIGLEFLINVQSNFNEIILLSFNGDIQEAVTSTDYLWLMFYPCLYFFAIWDAYKDASEETGPLLYVPFVFSAYFVTVGVIYSPSFTINGILLGPLWLPMLCLPVGIGVGLIVKGILLKTIRWKETSG